MLHTHRTLIAVVLTVLLLLVLATALAHRSAPQQGAPAGQHVVLNT